MLNRTTQNDLMEVQRIWGESFMSNMNRLEITVKELAHSHSKISEAIVSLTANVESLQNTTTILHNDITLVRENTADVKRVWEHLEDCKTRISNTENTVHEITSQMNNLKIETQIKLEPIVQDFEHRQQKEKEREKFRSGILFNITNNGVLAVIAVVLGLLYAGFQISAINTIQEQINQNAPQNHQPPNPQ